MRVLFSAKWWWIGRRMRCHTCLERGPAGATHPGCVMRAGRQWWTLKTRGVNSAASAYIIAEAHSWPSIASEPRPTGFIINYCSCIRMSCTDTWYCFPLHPAFFFFIKCSRRLSLKLVKLSELLRPKSTITLFYHDVSTWWHRNSLLYAWVCVSHFMVWSFTPSSPGRS